MSARHVSFVETGRSRPSAEMVLHLADQLDVPLRDRNRLLLAAGHAPVYGQRGLEEPEMGPVREMLELVLEATSPTRPWWSTATGGWSPATVPWRCSRRAWPTTCSSPGERVARPLHPEGMAPRIVNLAEWRAHLLERLGRQAVATGDPALATLHEAGRLPGGRPRARWTWPPARSLCRCGCARRAAPAQLHQHDHHVRDGARRDGLRALDRVVLPPLTSRRRTPCARS